MVLIPLCVIWCTSASTIFFVVALEEKAWDKAEDEKLLAAVREHGELWKTVALLLCRTEDAVRSRWLLHNSWGSAEDEGLQGAVRTHGKKWRKVAALFPGRTDDAVRDRWQLLNESGDEKPDDQRW